MKARTWMMQYGGAMMLSCAFALILGQVPLFRETAVGKLAASDLVQFLGYGCTLVLAWLGARQLSADPPEDWKWLSPYRALILPVTTLVAAIAWLIVTWVRTCAPLVAASAPRRLKRAA